MSARIATGLALAAAAVALTLWAPPWLFAALALALLLAALGEWNRLHPAPASASALGCVMAALILAAGFLFFQPHKLPMLCLAGLLFWGYQGIGLASAHTHTRAAGAPPSALSSLVQGAAVCLFAWCALVWMRVEQGAAPTLAMLLIIWSADTFAYFAGRAFGRRKLAPVLSPGKTVEGLAGGLAGAGAVALLAAFALELPAVGAWLWLLASLVAALAGVVGDLYESRLKRRAGVKDSGALLPGHGGILDRLDGLLAAAPVFAALWGWGWSWGWGRGWSGWS